MDENENTDNPQQQSGEPLGVPQEQPGPDAPATPFLAEEVAAVTEQPEGAKPARYSRVRENFEAVILAIIFVIVIREYVAEAYTIPSGSMEPTLMGDSSTGRGDGDRIIVDKMYYWFNPVARWDVVVFKYPKPDAMSLDRRCDFYNQEPETSDRSGDFGYCAKCHANMERVLTAPKVVLFHRNFIKRCVALPGETIRIRHGDIYITNDSGLHDEIPPRPPEAQADLWQRVYFCDFRLSEPFNNTWTITNKAALTSGDGRLVAEATGSAPVVLELLEVKDWHIGDNNEMLPRDVDKYGRNYVGDMMIETSATFAEENSHIMLEIFEDSCKYTASLGPGGATVSWQFGDGSQNSLAKSETEKVNFNFAPGVEYKIKFINLDDRLTLVVNDKPVWGERHFAKGEVPTPEDSTKASAMITIGGGKVVLGALKIHRDIYYTSNIGTNATRSSYQVPEGQFFVLGDNSPNSSDSRDWGTFPRANLIGRACFVFFPFRPVIDLEKKRMEWQSRLKLIR